MRPNFYAMGAKKFFVISAKNKAIRNIFCIYLLRASRHFYVFSGENVTKITIFQVGTNIAS
ncbi:hypothetical protein ACH95_10555 [Bacillus glycinifermentans]|nr:hypothetical protein ACH95_10555 [Bacillus glycinifermentans]